MSAIVCEVCGKPSSIHLTDFDLTRVPQKMDHHYCRDHALPEIQTKLGGPEDEARRVEQMIAQLDAQDVDPAQKAEFRRELEKLAEDIRAGRKRFGDAD